MYNFLTTPTVTWCEYLTQKTSIVTELTNSISNIAYPIAGIMAGGLDIPEIATANLVMCLVGVGSLIFHSTSTFLGQICDEGAMSILAYRYFRITREIIDHIEDTPIHFTAAYDSLYIGFTGIVWLVYLTTRIHEVFLAMFTLQIAYPIIMTISIPTTNSEKISMGCGFLSLGLGKACWEYERYLYRGDLCPTNFYDPLYYLHSMWHVWSAMAHYYLMKTWISISRRTNGNRQRKYWTA